MPKSDRISCSINVWFSFLKIFLSWEHVRSIIRIETTLARSSTSAGFAGARNGLRHKRSLEKGRCWFYALYADILLTLFLSPSLLARLYWTFIFRQSLLFLLNLFISFPIIVNLAHFLWALTFGAISTLGGGRWLLSCDRASRRCYALSLWGTCAYLGVHSNRFALDFYLGSRSSLDHCDYLIGSFAQSPSRICFKLFLNLRPLRCCFVEAKQ